MADSTPPSLSDIVDETYDESDDVETMTAAQVLAKLEEVNIAFRQALGGAGGEVHHPTILRSINASHPSGQLANTTRPFA